MRIGRLGLSLVLLVGIPVAGNASEDAMAHSTVLHQHKNDAAVTKARCRWSTVPSLMSP